MWPQLLQTEEALTKQKFKKQQNMGDFNAAGNTIHGKLNLLTILLVKHKMTAPSIPISAIKSL